MSDLNHETPSNAAYWHKKAIESANETKRLRAEVEALRTVVDLACNKIAPGGLYADLHAKLRAIRDARA